MPTQSIAEGIRGLFTLCLLTYKIHDGHAAFHKSEKTGRVKERATGDERNTQTSANNQTGIWEVKPNVACSTCGSFYSFRERIKKKRAGLIFGNT